MRGLFLLLAVAAVFPAATLAQKPGLEGFDEFASRTIEDWQVTGAAVAVVKDGQVVHLKGYGLRNVKQSLPVTPDTLFAIGSITKSFTVTVLGTLADEGKIDWDRPVREYAPDFRLFDNAATDRATLRDLVTHRTGLPRHDLLWYNSPLTRSQVYQRLRYLEPGKDLRTTYQYNNLMFMTAGFLAGRLTGSTWEELVRSRILAPLGMNRTNFSVADSQKDADFALPHVKVKEEIREIPFRNIDAVGPAGSINSSAREMASYLRLQLASGKYDGRQIVSPAQIRQFHSPQMATPGALRWKELGHASYGMGWSVGSYLGRKVVEHGGAIDGFNALVSFMPGENIGLAVLVNRAGSPLPNLLSYSIYERLLGLGLTDWNRRFKDDEAKGKSAEEEGKKSGLSPRRAGTRPSHELNEYAGEYEHPAYGIVKVELEGEKLRLLFNGFTGPLEHYHYDVFQAAEDPLNPIQKQKAQFGYSLNGDIDRLLLPLESSLKEIVFTRVAPKLDRETLNALAGEYALATQTITVSVAGGERLLFGVPGQPVRELAPVRGLRFNIRELTGFSVEFRKNSSGAVTEAALYQPNGTFIARRK
jgi:CubicO group peptidase (beta-lactamase class C family)